jgi:hypothetical protein
MDRRSIGTLLVGAAFNPQMALRHLCNRVEQYRENLQWVASDLQAHVRGNRRQRKRDV